MFEMKLKKKVQSLKVEKLDSRGNEEVCEEGGEVFGFLKGEREREESEEGLNGKRRLWRMEKKKKRERECDGHW